MSGRDLESLLQTKPFNPVRIYAEDGRTYDLTHPEQVIVMRTYVIIPISEDGKSVPVRSEQRDRVENLSIMHIVRVEEISTYSQNGAAAKSTD